MKTVKIAANSITPSSDPDSTVSYYNLYFMVLIVAIITIAGLYILQKLFTENNEFHDAL